MRSLFVYVSLVCSLTQESSVPSQLVEWLSFPHCPDSSRHTPAESCKY